MKFHFAIVNLIFMAGFSYLKKTLSRNLRIFRQAKKLTQDQLEELSGISRYTISEIETGGNWPRDVTLEKLASSLGVKPTDFFTDSENPIQQNSIREDILNQVKRSLKTTIDSAIDDLSITFNTTHIKPRK